MALAPRLAPGSTFARDYKIVDLLAEGGMGAVYRAEQLSTRKLRALKLVSTRLAADPKGHQRFVREATVGASIDSEHVVEVIGAGIDEDTGHPWLAMELLDGADLGAVVRHQGPLGPGQLREVVDQLCHGLAAAHQAGVVHRDLKPANIFVARSRRAGVPFTIKILDFGIAKVVQESGTGATDTDTVGSPLWMAPEQLNAQRPTPATDVWALGLLAFWALTGKHYWLAAHAESSTVQALFVEQLFKPLVPPSQRARLLEAPAEVPPGFDEWFLRCTHRAAPRRFADARVAGDALLERLAADPAAAARLLPDTPLLPSTSVTERQPSPHTETTVTTETDPAEWEASALVPGAAVAAARSSFEGDATRADTPGLGADLSRAPLRPGPPRGRRVSPLAVMVSVAVVVGVMVGLGYLAWQWQRRDDPVAEANLPEPPRLPDPPTPGDPPEPPRLPDPPSGPDSASDLPSLPTVDDGPAETTAADPFLELVVPRRTQLDHGVHDVRFLGWSESGHRFALQAEYRADKNGKPNRLTLIEVHDALTGAMIESFLVSREAAKGTRSYHELSKAAAEAWPKDDWPARRDVLALGHRTPTREAPGGGELRLEAEDPPEGTALARPLSSQGVAFRWISITDPVSGSAPGSAADSAGSGPNPKAPAMTLWYEHDGTQWTLLEIEPPFTQRQLAARRPPDGEDPMLEGHVRAYWSPDDARVVLILEAEVRPAGDAALRHQRWALRALGPQIRLVEAGAGQERLRTLAARLAAAGLPVAVAELRAHAEAQSSLVYATNRDGSRAIADQVRAVAPELLPEPVGQRRRRDFTAVVVRLGHDAR